MQALIKQKQEKIQKSNKKRGCAYFGLSLLWSIVCDAEKMECLKFCFASSFENSSTAFSDLPYTNVTHLLHYCIITQKYFCSIHIKSEPSLTDGSPFT